MAVLGDPRNRHLFCRVQVRVRWMRGALAVIAAVSCGACSAGVPGEPVAELWDPCTIPSDAIAAAGVNPEVLAAGTVDQDDNNWLYCSYRHENYVLSVASTRTPMDDIATNPRASGLTGERIAGRDVLIYSELVGTSDEACYVAYRTTFGAIEFTANSTGGATTNDLCSRARHFAESLADLTPQ